MPDKGRFVYDYSLVFKDLHLKGKRGRVQHNEIDFIRPQDFHQFAKNFELFLWKMCPLSAIDSNVHITQTVRPFSRKTSEQISKENILVSAEKRIRLGQKFLDILR